MTGCELSRTIGPRKAAYEQAEAEFQRKFGCRRYAGYNSFKVSSSNYRKKRKSL